MHPEIPAILITPICPHTLSFRPMLLPDSMELRICVPYNSRSTAWASFDGRGRVELRRECLFALFTPGAASLKLSLAEGDHIKVTASPYPFPTVCADKQSTDWFHSIARTLKWNERQRQKSFVILEEGRKKPRSPNADRSSATGRDRSTSEPVRSATTSSSPSGPVAGSGSNAPAPAAKRATFAETPIQERIGEDDDEDEDDELDEEDEEDDTAEEYDIDDVSESSPAMSASDPPAPGGIPAMSSKSTSPNSTTSLSDQQKSALDGRVRPRLSRPDLELMSNASSVSVDIQDDDTERYANGPPKPRGRSRSRVRQQQEQREEALRGPRNGGAVPIGESDEEKSQDRAFAVLGHDDDDSSQVRESSLMRSEPCCSG